MNLNLRKSFKLRAHNSVGVWETDDSIYRSFAHELLDQLESICIQVVDQWPGDPASTINNELLFPDLYKLVNHRNRTSDSVRIYAAMAIEGFLNFYGVLRFGQHVFDTHFERLVLVPKLRMLLLVGESLDIPKNDLLVHHLELVAFSRNELVHPKTRERTLNQISPDKKLINLPEAAQLAVKNMEEFFKLFEQAVPAMSIHLSPR